VHPVEAAAAALDPLTASRVQPALAWLSERSSGTPSPALVADYLSHELPRRLRGQGREPHEVAWALGDLFEHAGLPAQAAMCRSSTVHETLAVWQWTQSFGDVPAEFWRPALRRLRYREDVPARAALSMSAAQALLAAVGEGLALSGSGQLPLATVRGLDDRFRWTDEFPWMRITEERDLAPLRLLHEHLVAQHLLLEDGSQVTRSAAGVAATGSTRALWLAVVDPAPRWSREFDRDALGVMAASMLRTADFALGRIAEDMTHVLARKWGPGGDVDRGRIFDGAAPVAQAWYQLGVPLGWWDTGRGPADRRPNEFGRAAADAVFQAVAGPAGATSTGAG
jgi:hypothetical protein